MPPCLNFFGLLLLLLVPSGNITTLLFSFESVIPKFLIFLMLSSLFDLSIRIEPPFLKLNDILGIPLPKLFLLINFGCNDLKNQIIGGISYAL